MDVQAFGLDYSLAQRITQNWGGSACELDEDLRDEVVQRFLEAVASQPSSFSEGWTTPATAAFAHAMSDLRERMTIDRFFAIFSALCASFRHEISLSDYPPHEMLHWMEIASKLGDAILRESSKEWALERQMTTHLKDELAGLYRIASAIITNPVPDEVLTIAVEEILKLLKADFCALLQPKEGTSGLTIKATSGTLTDAELGEDPWLLKTFKTGSVQRMDDCFGFGHLLAAPLKVYNRILGVAFVANVPGKRRFNEADAYLLSTICSQAAAAIWNTQLFEVNARISLDLVSTLAQALDARDTYTHNHSTNVAAMGRRIALAMGLKEQAESIYMAGLLHDIGKIGIPDAVLHKPGSLNRTERLLMMQHPIKGAQMLQQVQGLSEVLPGIRHHHERWDGTGYPDRLRGEDIPLVARILSLADSFDVMCHNRVYRRARSRDEIIADLKRSSGKQFDPIVVEVLLDLLKKNQEVWPPAQPQVLEEYEVPEGETETITLTQFGKKLTQCLTQESILQRVVENAQKLLATDISTVWLVQNEETLRFAAAAGRSRFPNQEVLKIGGNGLVGYVAYRRIATAVSDYRSEDRFPVPQWIIDNGFSSSVAVPIESGDRLIGVLINHSFAPRHFANEQVSTLEAIASYAALALDNASLRAHQQAQAAIDPLTELPNHRHFQEQLHVELERSKRYRHAIGLLLLDVDNFQAYNESNGHSLGDEALCLISQILREALSADEIACRFGGEEFGLLLPGKSQEQAAELAENIRLSILNAGFPSIHGVPAQLTVSIGVTAFPDPTRDSERLLQEATTALSRAKRAGRNRIWVR